MRPREEQLIRAQKLGALGLDDWLNPDRLDAAALSDWLHRPPTARGDHTASPNIAALERLPHLAPARRSSSLSPVLVSPIHEGARHVIKLPRAARQLPQAERECQAIQANDDLAQWLAEHGPYDLI